MNKINNFLQKSVLNKKIESHFSKYPKSKSLLITSELDGNKVAWKVKKEGKGKYRVTEVRSTKNEYLVEAPVGGFLGATPALSTATNLKPQGIQATQQQQPARLGVPSQAQKQAQQQNLAAFEQQDFSSKISMLQSGVVPLSEQSLSSLFLDLMRPDALRNVVQLRKVLETLSSRVTPEARGLVGAFMGVLTTLSNHKKVVNADNRKQGKVVKEEQEDQEKGGDDKKLEPKLPDSNEKAEEDDEVDDEVGLESEPETEKPEDISNTNKNKSQEQVILQKNLTGQTIKNANLDLNANGGTLKLDLVNTNVPAEIKWSNTGGVVFNFKNRPYTIRRGK